jgi:hypothetical protein
MFMPKIKYVEKRFQPNSLAIIENANQIIEEYNADGLELTLRQLYYQFVSRGLIPNSDVEYKKLGSIINDARLAGLIDWEAIVDRTRNLRQNSHWSNASEILYGAAKQFQLNKWENQPNYCEVWIEKDALVGVIEKPCRETDVAFFSCRGYTSQSEMWAAAQRLRRHSDAGQTVTIFHLGDHDPSGVDMSRDIQDRLSMLSEGAPITLERIALTMAQIKKYNPPPNPAKLTDSRCQGYISEHGDKSWELDALEPRVLIKLVTDNTLSLRDEDLWDEMKEKEDAEKKFILDAAEKHEAGE